METSDMDAMIDIETLDTRTSAVVLSVGAVRFNPAYRLGICDTGDAFFARLAVDEQVARGRTVSSRTLSWWARQNDSARVRSFDNSNESSIDRAAADFWDWFKNPGEIARVWAFSPTFDLAILRDLWGPASDSAPWHYSQERDVRTVVDLAGLSRHWTPPVRTLPPHDPVGDAARQALMVCECYRILGLDNRDSTG